MPYQNINATLSAADLQAIRDAFSTIDVLASFKTNVVDRKISVSLKSIK